jgi:alkyl hydroperoxide reductase subunit AhpF
MTQRGVDYCIHCNGENLKTARISELGTSYTKVRCMDCGESWPMPRD